MSEDHRTQHKAKRKHTALDHDHLKTSNPEHASLHDSLPSKRKRAKTLQDSRRASDTDVSLPDNDARDDETQELAGGVRSSDLAVEWDPWPDGDFKRHFSQIEVSATKHLQVHWATVTSGDSKGSSDSPNLQGSKRSRRRCLGAIVCQNDDCHRVIRPKTKSSHIERQLQDQCQCGASLYRMMCNTVSFLYTYRKGILFEHRGHHNHPRPAHVLRLTSLEDRQLETVVTGHPNAGPLALLVGVPGLHGPGQSVAEISSILMNKDRLRAERHSIKNRGPKGGDGFIAEFAVFDREHPGFIVYSQIGDVSVISMQTSEMRAQMVKDSIDGEAVNGLVSDAAHGYWKQHNSLLIVTSSYAPDLHCWMPGLFSYSNGASAAHYEIHFYALFSAIAHEAREQTKAVQDELFGGVMDFSEAERAGFIQAFIRFWRIRKTLLA
ncbi:hypothetical protein B0H21DRAFT_804179 [Amylocystis lapponica]|nr:hypothetical protein B0H21DRAFT_804179 [Amylocystis lapponica]